MRVTLASKHDNRPTVTFNRLFSKLDKTMKDRLVNFIIAKEATISLREKGQRHVIEGVLSRNNTTVYLKRHFTKVPEVGKPVDIDITVVTLSHKSTISKGKYIVNKSISNEIILL